MGNNPEPVNLRIGSSASFSKTLTDQDVRGFADVVGDHNPVHLDEEFAKGTRFGGRIGHGMWAGGLISAALGTELPGPGTIYLSQTLNFRAPAYLGDVITATVEVQEIKDDKPIIVMNTRCENQRGEVLVEGEAVVLVPHLER